MLQLPASVFWPQLDRLQNKVPKFFFQEAFSALQFLCLAPAAATKGKRIGSQVAGAHQIVKQITQNSDGLLATPNRERRGSSAWLMSSAKVVRSVRAYANENLADHLHALCVDKSFNVINNRRLWYFPQFVECLIAAKKQWAEQQLKAVAKTSVYRLITKWCELAEQVEYTVVLEGSSRRGKTYACENYCRAYPHKFRFLATPDEPSYTAMLDALFQAIGIEESSTSSSPHKRRKLISEALEYSRITYIFDEAQFLFPPALKEGTTPQRLNFFRRIFMDTPQSVVLICTPQTLAKSSKRLRKIAKYETDQWDGRILGAPISLPDEFTEKELAEVMQMHLPEVDPGIPSYVAMIFRSVQEYRLSKLVSIAKLARSFARDEAQSIPKLSHVESAIKIVLSDRGAPSPD
jgi:AAA domain-containing protein